jgi:hypothetical protein
MSKPSPTSRTLAKLKELGFTAGIVEKWNMHARIRQDLFGFCDIVAVREGVGVVFIQACAGASHSARKTKMLSESRMWDVLKAGGKVELWSWAKRGGRGKRKLVELRRESITWLGSGLGADYSRAFGTEAA